MVGNRHRQRSAFFWICRRSQFIQQHQRARRRCPRDEINVGDMRRKRRKVLFDGLVIANIGQHRVEHWHFHSARGNWNSSLGHEREQAGRLEADCLSARVRPGDDELAPLPFKLNRNRNHGLCRSDTPVRRLCFCPKIPLQQRMPRVSKN